MEGGLASWNGRSNVLAASSLGSTTSLPRSLTFVSLPPTIILPKASQDVSAGFYVPQRRDVCSLPTCFFQDHPSNAGSASPSRFLPSLPPFPSSLLLVTTRSLVLTFSLFLFVYSSLVDFASLLLPPSTPCKASSSRSGQRPALPPPASHSPTSTRTGIESSSARMQSSRTFLKISGTEELRERLSR